MKQGSFLGARGSSEGAGRGGRLRTAAPLVLLGIALVAVAAYALTRTRESDEVQPLAVSVEGTSPTRFSGFGGGSASERKVVEQFDEDGDERLNAEERAAARAWLASNGDGEGGGGRGGRRGSSVVPGTPGPRLTPAEVVRYPATVGLYDPSAVRTLFLEFESDDWEDELAAFNNTDVEVPATVIVDGRRYADVGVHFRGASSFSMVPEGSKRSLNLAFDFTEGEQRLNGYRTLNLLNANSDPTFTRTVLYSAIAQEYIPAPRANFAQVVINGESWGVYVNVQQFNKDFLRDFYGTTDGARWKVPGSPRGRGGLEYLGESPDPYRALYEIKSADDEESWAALIALTRVLNQTSPERLEAALAPILDIDGVLRFLALEVAMANTDGYWSRASDYSLYRDPRGCFHVIPHDMNEALGVRGGRDSGEGAQLDPLVALTDVDKPLRSNLLAVPALRERYIGYIREIANRSFNWEEVGPLVERYQAMIEDEVARDTRKLYSTEAFGSEVESLREFFEARRRFLLSEEIAAR